MRTTNRINRCAERGFFRRRLWLSAATALCCASMLPGSARAACTPALAGEISWWRAEDDASDAAGSNHGTLHNGAGFTAGQVGKGFLFDGIDDRVGAPDAAALDLVGALSVSAWVQVSSHHAGAYSPIAAKWGNSDFGTAGYGLFIAPGAGQAAFALSSTGHDLSFALDDQPLPAGLHHVAGVYDGATMQLYVDGSAAASSAYSGAVYANDAPLVIGAYDPVATGGSYALGGVVDEVLLLGRALTPAEVLGIYQAGAGLDCIACGDCGECGNGSVEIGEQCDDSNTAAGDCCDASCQFEGDGSPCDDREPCTVADACAAGTCVGQERPADPCLAAAAGKLVLLHWDKAAKRSLVWQWAKGPELTQSAFGDPTTPSGGLVLCVYDASHLVTRVDVGAGTACGVTACWSAIKAIGYRYKDKPGSDQGVTGVVLKGGKAGKSFALLKGKGSALPYPSLPLVEPVTAQLLRADGGLCLGASFAGEAIRGNDATRFVGKR